MASENGHKQVNLVQYRRVADRWQIRPVVRKNGKPDPRLILIHGEPTNKRLVLYFPCRANGLQGPFRFLLIEAGLRPEELLPVIQKRLQWKREFLAVLQMTIDGGFPTDAGSVLHRRLSRRDQRIV